MRSILESLPMRRLRCLTLLSILLFWLLPANTASPVRSLSIAEGLSQKSALSIVQDQRGFIWIGTRDGLNRFDGRQMRVFREELNRSDTVYGQTINAIALADKGGLYIGSDRGLSIYDPLTESFNRIRLDKNGETLADIAIFDLLRRRNGEIWLATMRGLYRYDPIRQQLIADNTITATVYALAETPSGQLWVGQRERLLHYNDQNGEFTSIAISASVAAYGGLRRLLTSDDEYIWLSGWQTGVSRLHIPSGKVEQRRLREQEESDGDFVHSMVLDSEQRLWLGTRFGGLFVINAKVHDSIAKPERSLLLQEHTISSLMLDRDRLLWVGTDRDGVHLLSLQSSRFNNYFHQDENNKRWRDDDVRAVYSTNENTIWAGTANGLHRIDRNPYKVTYYPLRSASKKELRADAVHALAARHAGGFWLGTEAGLYRYDANSDRVVAMNAQVPDLPIDRQHALVTLYEDSNADLWLGTFGNGVFRLRNENQLQRWPTQSTLQSGIRGQFIFALLHDAQKRLWIGHENGIDIYDERQQHYEALTTEGDVRKRLSHPAIQTLFADRRDDIWIGTLLGLNRWSAREQNMRHYFVKNGLPNNTIYAILQDQQGMIWCSTNNGFARINPDNDQIDVFDQRHGVHNSEFNGGSAFATSTGELLFGGVDGFSVFDPAQFVKNANGPALALTALKIFDQERSLSPVLDARQQLDLSYRDSAIRIDLAALQFAQSEQNRYAYRLDPVDRDWVDLGTQSFITLRNLPADHYQLRLRAANADGVVGEERQLALNISPPWWASTLAYVLYVVTAIVLAIAVSWWRTRRLRQRTHQLEQTVIERTQQISEQNFTLNEQAQRLTELLERRDQLFANVSHEFRTPLTLISSPAAALLQQEQTPQQRQWLLTIQRNSARLLRMVDQLLDLSRLQAGKPMPTEAQNLSAIAEELATSYQTLAARQSLHFHVSIAHDVWVRSQGDAIEQIISNLLSNAFKFTARGGEVFFSVTTADNVVLISVRDNGIGIPSAHQRDVFERFYRVARQHTENTPGAGLGLAVVREWVLALHGNIDLHSVEGQGTEIRIALPQIDAPDIAATQRKSQPQQWQHDKAPGDMVHSESGNSLPQLLIVEDNAELRLHLQQLLSPHFQCIGAADGAAGLALAIEQVPDIVLCDVAMPIMDGFELARHLRQDDRCSHIPFVFLTAYGDKDSRLQGLRELADDYIAKPFDNDELTQRLLNLLSLRSLLQQRYRQQATLNHQSAPELSERDDRLLRRLRQLFDEHSAEPEFDIAQMAQAVAMSERQLQRKLQALLALSPTEYLKLFRLQRAADLLLKGQAAGQVAIDVGFSSQAYFTRCFKAHFGIAPGQYRQHLPP